MPDSLMDLCLLETLVLRSTRFNGTISQLLGQLTQLTTLSIELTTSIKAASMGSLPASIAQCTRLNTLILRRSWLTGFASLPPPLPSLERLTLEFSNTFSVSFDQLVKAAPNLIEIQARSCGIYGHIELIGTLKQLTYLDISETAVLGPLYHDFWQLTNLETIDFRGTRLYAIFDHQIGVMKNLRHLYLMPALMGSIPSEIGNCTELETLAIHDSTALTGTLPGSLGNLKKLYYLSIQRTAITGTFPSALCDLTEMEILQLGANALEGTLPPCMVNLRKLGSLSIFDNRFEGQLPNFEVPIRSFYLSRNRFTGTIPPIIAAGSSWIYLENNLLGPFLDPQAFVSNANLVQVTVANNRFGNCSLPEVPPNVNLLIDMSGNEFIGTIPWSYRFAKVVTVHHNKLSGGWDHLLLQADPNSPNAGTTSRHPDSNSSPADANSSVSDSNSLPSSDPSSPPGLPSRFIPTNPNIEQLLAGDNQFSGTLPNLFNFPKLIALEISKNQWSGPLPALPLPLIRFIAPKNRFDGPLSDEFLRSIADLNMIAGALAPEDNSMVQSSHEVSLLKADQIRNTVLKHLDLSNNELECPQADARLLGSAKMSRLLMLPSLDFLSLANNNFTCEFAILPNGPIAPLVSLDLSHNRFSGRFPFSFLSSLMSLKMTSSGFSGQLSLLNFPLLTVIDVSDNDFSGDASATFVNSPFLVSYNAAGNRLTGGLTLALEYRNLETLDLSHNQLDGIIDLRSLSLHFTDFALQILKLDNNPKLIPLSPAVIEANQLLRTTSSSPSKDLNGAVCYDLRFNGRDSTTFSYDEALFDYYQCDCNSTHYGAPQECISCPSEGMTQCSRNNFTTAPTWYSFEAPAKNGRKILRTESCIYSATQQIIGNTNCRGVTLLFPVVENATSSISSALKPQCEPGSDGRLCSRCICDPEECYFLKGANCVKCSHTFKLGASIGLFFGVYICVMILATVIMFAILRSRRTKSLTPWVRLPLFRRVFLRFLYLTSLGNVSITITFLQLLVALTNWDSYILRGVLELLNGSPDSFGLRCAFPILADPMAALLIKLFIPVFFITNIALSIAMAEFISRKLNRVSGRKRNAPSEPLVSVTTDWVPLLSLGPDVQYVPFPATALFTSMALTMIKFFYFGTAITAHEYIFASVQPYTGVKYVQNQPWMKFQDAMSLIGVSVPAILIYDLIFPISFILLCIRLRRTYDSPESALYLGSLFSTFSRQCFWWEIINILKKLLIALLLQGIPSSSATQSSLILSVLAGTQIVQLSLAPWKRKVENLFDAISAVLLIGSFQSVRSAHLSASSGSIYYMLSLDMLFVVASAATIGYQTWTGQTDYQRDFDPRPTSGSLISEGSFFSESEAEESQEELDDDPLNSKFEYSSVGATSIETSEDEAF